MEPGKDNNLVTEKDERVKELLAKLQRIETRIGKHLQKSRPVLGGEQYLTEKELARVLKISPDTLQDYRANGTIPFCTVGRRILYKSSDIEKILKDNYYDVIP